MPNAETSFADRVGRARLLKDTVANFSPVYAPSAAANGLVPYANLIAACDTANDLVQTTTEIYAQDAATRVMLVRDLKKAVTRALAEVESNSAWKVQAPKLKSVADALRGIQPPPVKVPAGGTPKPKRNRGDQSYGDIRVHLVKWLAGLTKLPGYAPAAAEISLGTFNGILSTLKNMNETLPTQESDVDDAVIERETLFNGEAGLRERMLSIKKAVKSQSGTGSNEDALVKGINV